VAEGGTVNERLDALEAEAVAQEARLAEIVNDTAALLARSREAHVNAARLRARVEAIRL